MIGAEFPAVLARAQGGDEAAFALLWRDLHPALLRYLRLTEEAADDIASETWATVVKGMRRFSGSEAAWRSWVFVTARRRAVDAGRRRARTAQVEEAWRARSPEASAADPADVVGADLDTEAAVRLVAQLSPLQAEVIVLRVLTGLSPEEVGRIVGRSPGAVRVATHRGLKRLEQIMSGKAVTQAMSEAL